MMQRQQVGRVRLHYFMQGMIAMLPLSIAVIPWGILAGSMAINAGLSVPKAIAMSAMLFAGAAQLVSLGLHMSETSSIAILLTIFFLTSQHFIYALVWRDKVARFSLKSRLGVGFLLTDELFALRANATKHNRFYLLGAGLCFYLFWIVFSIVGIVLASAIPNLDQFHLDFSIVAIFVPIIVSLIKSRAAAAGVAVSCTVAMIFYLLQLPGTLIVAGISGMFVAALIETMQLKKEGKKGQEDSVLKASLANSDDIDENAIITKEMSEEMPEKMPKEIQ